MTDAYATPSCFQNTNPQVSHATEVISATCSLRHVHTESIHGESEARVSKTNPTDVSVIPALRRSDFGDNGYAGGSGDHTPTAVPSRTCCR
ncbi:hypothetical protein Ntsu_36030 [Nocardia sp. IFM 10818]